MTLSSQKVSDGVVMRSDIARASWAPGAEKD